MNRLWILVVMLAVIVAGRQLDRTAEAEPVTARLGEQFTLAGGQDVTLTDADVRIRFTAVAEDSRCPTQVQCVWTGQARVAADVTIGQKPSTTVEFNTNPAPGMGRQTVDVDGYAIELIPLDPYPETPDDSPALEDYRATLLVRKVG